MAKPPAPPAFNPDGTPKGHRATVAGHDSSGDYALEPAETLPKHDLKPSANPISPDLEKLKSKKTTPEQETPTKGEPESGKLDSDVESHGRYAATPDATVYNTDANRFSITTATVISIFALAIFCVLFWLIIL
ncbi:MAG: hypothetical protein AAGD32_06980 [Planctomycetota bacterium]